MKCDSILKDKYIILKDIRKKMTKISAKKRPNCDIILNERSLWSLRLKDIKHETEVNKLRERLLNEEKFDNNFVLLFMNKVFYK